MRVRLMHRDRDFDPGADLPANAGALVHDLELETLVSAMAADDELVGEVARQALLDGLREPGEIVYRQRVLADCIEHPGLARELYELATGAIEARRRALYLGRYGESPDTILGGAVRVLELLLPLLHRLRELAGADAESLRSEGFRRLFATLADELDEAFFERAESHLRELRFEHGVLLSARLGRGNRGTGYVLRRQPPRRWRDRLADRVRRPRHSFEIAERDEAGFRALGELRGRGVDLAANATAQAADHVLAFFTRLRTELAFYLGCLNLREALTAKGEPVCFPAVAGRDEGALSASGLYDPCLALHLERRATGNAIAADSRRLVVITGANQGGKSTFLRAAGVAQLMTQAGMFVAAESLRASVCEGVFTHFRREEDEGMERGKLDDELARMSEIAGLLRPGSLLLCNESFASTNEREGSEIARQVVRALTEAGVRVLFVTHMYELAHGLYAEGADGALFLRAERGAGGRRPYRIAEGEPLATSYGRDSYVRVFGERRERPAVAAANP